MELRPEQLATQAGTQPLAPVYLIAGPELLRDRAVVCPARGRILEPHECDLRAVAFDAHSPV